MFLHLFLYRLKSLFRTRSIIFWTMLFPVLLSVLFKFAFGSTSEIMEKYKTIPVAAVMEQQNPDNERVLSILESVEFSKGNSMFKVSTTTLEKAQKMLLDGSIDGIIVLGSGITLSFTKSDINQSIIRQFVTRYLQTEQIITDIAATSPEN